MLEIVNLSTAYGGIKALRKATLSVPDRGMIALIGPNGAGKSTLLNTVSGLLRASGGRIIFDGADLAGVPDFQIARRGLVQVPEGRQILGSLTVQENLEVGRLAAGRGATSGGDLDRVYAIFPVLADRRRAPAGVLSGGQQQMLAIGRALMGQPRLLLLDEPSLGLSPLIAKQVFAVLTRLNAEGLAILLVEQNARQALAMTNHAYILEQGRIVHSGPGSELAQDPRIIAHYLGRGASADRTTKAVVTASPTQQGEIDGNS